MGYSYDDRSQADASFSGDVVYRKKHIRLHNRNLKMKHHKAKHTYFDDSGTEIKETETAKNESNILVHSSSDDDSNIIMMTVAPLPRMLLSIVTTSTNDNKLDKCPTATIGNVDDKEVVNDELVENLADAMAEDEVDEAQGGGIVVDAATENRVGVKKEKKRRRKNKILAAGLPPEIANDKSLLKYWYKRFSLFSLFDMGIKLDRGLLLACFLSCHFVLSFFIIYKFQKVGSP